MRRGLCSIIISLAQVFWARERLRTREGGKDDHSEGESEDEMDLTICLRDLKMGEGQGKTRGGGGGEGGQTVHSFEDSVHSAGAASAGHGDVELVVVCWGSHGVGMFLWR